MSAWWRCVVIALAVGFAVAGSAAAEAPAKRERVPKGWEGTLSGTLRLPGESADEARPVRVPRVTLSFHERAWTIDGPFIAALSGRRGPVRADTTPLRTTKSSATAPWVIALAGDAGLKVESLRAVRFSGSSRARIKGTAPRIRVRVLFGTTPAGSKAPAKKRGMLVLRDAIEAPTEAGTAILDANGGDVATESVSATFDPGVLSGAAQVTLERGPFGQVPLALADGASDVVRLSLAAGSLAPGSDSGAVLRGIAMEPPAPALETALRAASEYDTRLNLITMQVFDPADTARFGQEVLYGPLGTPVHIPHAQLEALVSAARAWSAAAKVSIESRIVDVARTRLSFGPTLWRWNESASAPGFEEVGPQSPNTGTQRIVVLLHGWQALQNVYLGDTNLFEAHEATWRPFLNYVTQRAPERATHLEKLEFFAVRYDSDRSLERNATEVFNLLGSHFGNAEIVVVGHSMGGLVGHVFARKKDAGVAPFVGASLRVARLVTLGTPFHGTPAVQRGLALYHGLALSPGLAVPARLASVLALPSPGTLGLAWDGADGKLGLVKNGYLADLNGLSVPAPRTEYRTIAGELASSGHSYFDYSSAWLLPDYSSDGIVPVPSAHFESYSSGSGFQPSAGAVAIASPVYFEEYDHAQLHAGHHGDLADTATFERILEQLPPIPVDPEPSLFEVTHIGSADPLGEGWISYYSPPRTVKPGVDVGAFPNDGGTGRDAWGFDKDEDYNQGTLYMATLTPEQTALAASEGWRFSAWIRIPTAGFHTDYSVPPTSSMMFIPQPDSMLNLTVGLGSNGVLGGWLGTPADGSFTVTGSTTGYHYYEIVWRPSTASADLYVDGQRVAAGVAYRATGSTESNTILWGAGSGNALGQVRFSDLKFEVGPTLPASQQ